MTKDDYEAQLYDLQVELVKLQKHLIHSGEQILVILEGRDAAGKDGVVKSIVEHLSPRETRVVALGKPTERELGEELNVTTLQDKATTLLRASGLLPDEDAEGKA